MAEACHQQRKVVILIALHDAGADPAMLAGDHIRVVERSTVFLASAGAKAGSSATAAYPQRDSNPRSPA
jgi:hypothetical protein